VKNSGGLSHDANSEIEVFAELSMATFNEVGESRVSYTVTDEGETSGVPLEFVSGGVGISRLGSKVVNEFWVLTQSQLRNDGGTSRVLIEVSNDLLGAFRL
jgi:hypothetical protein